MPGKRERSVEVKVTIIETQYVETDTASFRSVVQKLTGKDSTAAETAAKTLATAAAATGSWHAAAESSDAFGCCRGEGWYKELVTTTSSAPMTMDSRHHLSFLASNIGGLMGAGGSSWAARSVDAEEDDLWELLQLPREDD